MDEYVLVKTYDLTNFNKSQEKLLISDLINKDLFSFDDIIFNVSDYNLNNKLF
jgi:hypothetical protein